MRRARKVDLKQRVSPPSIAPWMVVRHPGGDPVYKKTFREARGVIEKDLDRFDKTARDLMATDMTNGVHGIRKQLSDLQDVVVQGTSQWVEGVPDPFLGVKYRAEIRRREEF